MTDPSRARCIDPQGSSSHVSDGAGVPTVASLGIQVRLIPMGHERERELARLIASCEILRNECERMFRRTVDLLNEDRCSPQDSPSSSSDR
jgi:hypothetical protein